MKKIIILIFVMFVIIQAFAQHKKVSNLKATGSNTISLQLITSSNPTKFDAVSSNTYLLDTVVNASVWAILKGKQGITGIQGIGYAGLTSTTTVTITTGNKTLTTNLSKTNTAFAIGNRIRISYTTTPANYMEGVVTSFSGTSLIVNIDYIGGSGTYASWNIGIAGAVGLQGIQGIQGVAGTQGLQGIQGIQGIQGKTGSFSITQFDSIMKARYGITYATDTTRISKIYKFYYPNGTYSVVTKGLEIVR